tara:strand:+ start:54 stop:935 length:882 start_codon:yes stop_codon:yes gene_type:complete
MANWSTGKPKIGDTRGWNERDQTGYKWDGKKWVQYYKGKPLGPFKGHGGITGNVDVVGGIKSGVLGSANRIGRAISGAPSDEDYQFVEEQGGRINEPKPVDGGYGDNLESTMGFNPDSEPIIKGLTDGFTGNLGPLDRYFDETDTTNLLNLYGIGNNDLVSRETGNKGGFWDKLSNSFSEPDPNLEDVTTAGGKVQEKIQSGQPLKENQYQTWNTDMDENEGVVGTVGDKEWTKDFEDPETKAKREFLEKSRNTPAAKAFAQDDFRNENWNKLRWEAQKRHNKLFDYNTDKEK